MAIVIAGGATAATQLPVLAKIQPGRWQLKEIGGDARRSVCIGDPAAILQIGHGDASCARTVIDSTPAMLTVRYTCQGKGQGRSVLTFRSAGSFRLQTQGLAAGAPFDFDYEARRTGDCGAATGRGAGR